MSPLELDQLLQTAQGHHQSGHLTQAEMLYRQILSLAADHHGALHGLGVLALQRGRPDIALDLLRRAAALQPAIAIYQGNLGNACMALGQFQEAIAAYRRSLELQPDFAQAHAMLGNALAAE